jgi:hypothetical protein
MIAHSNRVSPAFLDKVKLISTKLGINPSFLMMAMFKETGGTFSPSIKNPTSSATGLIQFMEATAKRLGTTTAKLRAMSALDQLDFVYKYFLPFKGRLKSFPDVYLAIFYPAGIGKSDSWRFPNWVYKANRGIDLNKDGILTIGDFKKWALKGQPKVKNDLSTTNMIVPLILFGFLGLTYYFYKS